MPIRELTERPTIPRLGKIRLGDNSGRNGAPVNKPFFVCPPEVQAIYGDEPTELRIVFLSEDLERIASQYFRSYNQANGLVCKGDGFKADPLIDQDELVKNHGDLTQPLPLNMWAHGNTGNRGGATTKTVRTQIDCPGSGYDGQPACPAFAAKKCSVRAFLQFAIRDVPGLGVYQMDTGSVVSIKKLNGTLELAKTIVGGVAGVPMIMRRVQQEVSPDGMKKKVWMVELEVDTDYSLTRLLELRSGPNAMARALLPPVDESEVYEPLDEEEDEAAFAERVGHQVYEGEVIEHGAMQQTGDGSTVRRASPPAAAPPAFVTPQEWFERIEKDHGRDAKVEAIKVMTRLCGTGVVTQLSNDQRHILSPILQARWEQRQHEHELAMSASGFPHCSVCGDELNEDGAPVTAQATLLPT